MSPSEAVEEVKPLVPAGFAVVTEVEFFQRLRADPRDIMPDHSERNFTYWRSVRDRAAWGWSMPGWANPDLPGLYAVRS